MSRYTLKTYDGSKQVEVFEHRTASKIRAVLCHPRFVKNQSGMPYDEIVQANKFEIVDSQRLKMFEGNIDDAIAFTRGLR